jgi:predicted nucleic-acid-binding protein
VKALLDTNVLIRHMTGAPTDQARGATSLLAGRDRLLLVDLVVAEAVYVLESVYGLGRESIAGLLRSVLAMPAIEVMDSTLVLRALDVYEVDRLDFADAYLVASAEISGVGCVASFDRAIDRVRSVERLEPVAA